MELSEASFLREGEVALGTASFEFIDQGRLLAFRQDAAATWMIGRDDASDLYTVLYSDDRGVSRVYLMTLEGAIWKVWRDHLEFSQRFEAIVSAELDLITGRWEKRAGRGSWEHDFAVTYRGAAYEPHRPSDSGRACPGTWSPSPYARRALTG